MPKIAFIGAGSTVFAKNVLGDSMQTESLKDSHIALYDINRRRLQESKQMLDALNRNTNDGRARITTHHGVRSRRTALSNADYVVNAIQVGGYKPSTVIDFEIPKKFGLRQTIGDTLGIGGIFRGLRTIPVMLDLARDMEAVCPDAWLLNYTNPMAMVTGAVLQGTSVKTVGLCHSVQGCADWLLTELGMREKVKELQWKIAGINHMGWLLEISDGSRDLYPEIKRRAAKLVSRIRKNGGRPYIEKLAAKMTEQGKSHWDVIELRMSTDLVRLEIMRQFGFYVTESSEHSAEYMPYWIKSRYPGLIDEFNIPLDEYPRRCVAQIEGWKKQSRDLVANPKLDHTRTHEYGASIMDAMETDTPFRIGGNVLNTGLITNLPSKACVEVSCMVDRNGVQGCYVGDLPEQLAALNRTNVNVQLLTIEAALTRKRDAIYHAALLDPHTASELSMDEIVGMCDELIEAHGSMMPAYQ